MEVLIVFGIIILGIIAYVIGNKLIKKQQTKGNKNDARHCE